MVGCVKIAGWMAALNVFLVLCFGVVLCLLIYSLPVIMGGILGIAIVTINELVKGVIKRFARRA